MLRTVSYVSEEVAVAFGLSVAYEKVTANVLRERLSTLSETFDSIPVCLTLESCDGNDKVSLKTPTCPRRVTGSYKIVNWQKYNTVGLT